MVDFSNFHEIMAEYIDGNIEEICMPHIGYAPEVHYFGLSDGKKANSNKLFLYCYYAAVGSQQITFNSKEKMRYRTHCLYFIDVTFPSQLKDGWAKASLISKKIQSLLRKMEKEHIWIREVNVNTADFTGGVYSFRIVATIEYDSFEE